MHELSKLAEKDPEFFKYLQENDKELLDFNPNSMGADEDDNGDMEEVEEAIPILTKQTLQTWQKVLLEVRTLALFSLVPTF